MNDLKANSSEKVADNNSLLTVTLRWLDKFEELASVFFMVVVLGAVSVQVIARYVFQQPIYWADELARYSYVWLAFTAAIFITGRRQHITIFLLDSILSERQLRWLASFAHLVIVVLCACLAYFAFEWLLKTARPKSSSLRLPMIWLYGGVWVSFVLMGLHSFINFMLIFTGRVPVSSDEDKFTE